MKFFVLMAAFLLSSGMSLSARQSSNSANQATPDTATAAVQTSATSADVTAEKSKTKAKKVWTNEEISGVGGEGAISVVGKAGGAGPNVPSNNFQKIATGSSARDQQAAVYRDRLHRLNIQLETINKKIAELRNFKAENSSPSGGINMHQRYDMTPVQEQIKELEEKKEHLQGQIEAVEDQARKNGFEPGQLR
jgi:chaperonin cofactor prefoldin